MKIRKMFYVIFLIFILIVITYIKSYLYISDRTDLTEKQITNWGYDLLNLSELPTNLTGEGIKIAVMDSGVSYEHEDLGDNIQEGYNLINPKKLPVENHLHGTSIIGIISALDNDLGIVGMAPNAKIYPIKVLDEYGEGNLEDIAEGINWCIENDIQIINMSFSFNKDNLILKKAVDKAVNNGIIIVASASNSFDNKVGYPANYDNVISVTAIDKNLSEGNIKVRGKIDFSAPGIDIITLLGPNEYVEISGSSIATPYITSVISLILENPQIFKINNINNNTFLKVYETLESLSKDLGERYIYGHGIPTFENYKKIFK